MVPVAEHGAGARHQPVGDVLRAGHGVRALFRRFATERRHAGTQHVHRMGAGRQQFENGADPLAQAAESAKPAFVRGERRGIRQFAVDQQMRNLFEFAALGEIQDVVAAVMQVVAGTADRADRGVAGDDPGQRDGFLGFESGSFAGDARFKSLRRG